MYVCTLKFVSQSTSHFFQCVISIYKQAIQSTDELPFLVWKFGFIKQVDNGGIPAVKDLEGCRFKC